jgi:hypothetical protein
MSCHIVTALLAEFERGAPFFRREFLIGMLGLLAAPGRPALGDDSAKNKPNSEPKELTPRLFTLQANDISLAKTLAEIEAQTGNKVQDRRQSKDESKLRLDLRRVTFWQALDAVAKQIDARVSLYERDGMVALVDGPHVAMPVSYSGLFRTSVKRIDLIRILESDNHVCNLYLEVAWEPRFQPLFMETKPDSLEVQDDKGRTIDIPEGGKGMAAVGRKVATEIQIRFPGPQRSASQLGLFKGKLAAIGPSKMLTFTFDKLTKIEKKEQALKQTIQGVTVNLRELRNEGADDDQVWTVGLLLEYPADGPKLESFQSWLVNNEIYLEKEKDGIKQRFTYNLGLETGDQTDTRAIIRYRFGDEPDKKLILGKYSDWKLVYRTPGKISEIPIPFEFKDLPLP